MFLTYDFIISENLTPPREKMPQKGPEEKGPSPERDLTPPLPETVKETKLDSDDELDLILDDIDDILSDDDSGRFKEKKELVVYHSSKSTK